MAYTANDVKKSGAADLPPRIVIYGGAKVGKSTFAAQAPNPFFIMTEEGAEALDVDTLGMCQSWQDVEDNLKFLLEEPHDYKTVVLDSADWAESLMKQQVADDHHMPVYNTNGDKNPLAYGRGGRAIEEYWHKVVRAFDNLRHLRGMGVIITSHSQVKRFDDPTTDAYDRYQPDLEKNSAAVLKEWSDFLLFVNKRVAVVEEKVGINTTKKRGMGTDDRLVFTTETPAFIAGSRWPIPPVLPLKYEVVMGEIDKAKAAMKAFKQPELIQSVS